ncbi:MAG: hypothetical protein LRZ85_07565 [Alphaproteobacteria bacterium]|nr:hypothetical protein [Alphaproteobacteria bacterium]MCD8520556.1 hypothetical protein [Alphaproteobacteria bacterium]MCD8571235.1 hypothetical protein [Alphaproteobacteria bacterium]
MTLNKRTAEGLFRADIFFLQEAFAKADAGGVASDLPEAIEEFLASTFKAAILDIPKENPQLKAEASKLLERVLLHFVARGDGTMSGYVDGIKMIVDLDGDPDKLKRFLEISHSMQSSGSDDKPEFTQ